MSNKNIKIRPLLGTFELALFLPAGALRFPKTKKQRHFLFLFRLLLRD